MEEIISDNMVRDVVMMSALITVPHIYYGASRNEDSDFSLSLYRL